MVTRREEFVLSVTLDLNTLKQQLAQFRAAVGNIGTESGQSSTPSFNTAPYRRFGQEAGRQWAQGFQAAQAEIGRVLPGLQGLTGAQGRFAREQGLISGPIRSNVPASPRDPDIQRIQRLTEAAQRQLADIATQDVVNARRQQRQRAADVYSRGSQQIPQPRLALNDLLQAQQRAQGQTRVVLEEMSQQQKEQLAAQIRITQGTRQHYENLRQAYARQDAVARQTAEAGTTQQQLEAARKANAAAVAAANAPYAGGRGGAGGAGRGVYYGPSPMDRFRRGFIGPEQDPLETLGRATRFTVFYGGMYRLFSQLQQGIQQGVQGTLEFANAISQLNLATGGAISGTEKWADTLGEIGTAAGFTSAQGVQTAARAQGLFDLVQEPDQARRRQQTEEISRIAMQTSFLGGEPDPQGTLTKYAGVLRSFNLANDQMSRFADSLAVISQQSGQTMADLLEGAAEIGPLAQQAGYSAEETLAIIARITSTRGTTPTGAAGSLNQVFSKANDPALEARLRSLGVDTQGTTMKQQVDQLRRLNLNQETMNRLIASVGRGSSGQAFSILLNQGSQINRLTGAAQGAGATGALEDQFKTMTGNMSYQLRLLGREAENLFVGLANTGVADALVPVLAGLKQFVALLDNLVDIFNQIPRPLRTAGFGLMELYAATALLSRLNFGRMAAGMRAAGLFTSLAEMRTAGAGAIGAAATGLIPGFGLSTTRQARYLSALTAAATVGGQAPPAAAFAPWWARRSTYTAESLRGAAGTAGGYIRNTSALNMARGAGSALAAVPGLPVIGAALGVAFAGQVIEEWQQSAALDEMFTIKTQNVDTSSVEGLRSAADSMRGFAAEASKQQQGPMGFLFRSGSWTQTEQDRQAALLQANVYDVQAKRLQAAQEAAARSNPATRFAGFDSAEAVTQQLQEMSDQGYSAAQQIGALTEAFRFMTDSAKDTGARISLMPGQVGLFTNAGQDAGTTAAQRTAEFLRAQGGQRGLFDNILSATQTALQPIPGIVGMKTDFLGLGKRRAEKQAALVEQNQAQLTEGIQDTMRQTLEFLGKDLEGPITLDEAEYMRVRNDAKNRIIANAQKAGLELSQETANAIGEFYASAFRAAVGDFDVQDVTPENLDAYLSGRRQAAQTEYNENTIFAHGDTSFAAAERRNSLQEDMALGQRMLAEAVASKDPEKIAEVTRKLRATEMEYLQAQDDYYKNLVQDAEDEAQQQVNRASIFDDFAQADAQLAAAAAKVQAAKDTNQGADEIRKRQDEYNRLAAQTGFDKRERARESTLSRIDPRRTGETLRQQLNNARQRLADIRAGGGEQGDKAYDDAVAEIARIRIQQGDYLRSEKYARKRAQNVMPGNVVYAAKVDMQEAKATLDSLSEGDEGYWQAVADYHQKQQEYADALLQRASVQRQLGIDISDPLATAQAAVDDAIAKLNDPQTDTRDERDAAKLALRQARLSQQQTQHQEFMRRLADQRELEDISDSEYMAALQARLDNLRAIKNPTQEIKNEITDIRKAMKSATDSLTGQWNIGDIKLPTPYEIRRGLQGTLGTNQTVVDASTNQVTINGADLEQVIAWVTKYIKGGTLVTSNGNRRV